MSLIDALILGIVEGLTEFLPISSTGHLILTSQWLHLEHSDQTKAFEVIIQAGAIVAVLIYYRAFFVKILQGLAHNESKAKHFSLTVLVAFLPAAALGLTFGSKIKEYLFSPTSVSIALIVGGLFMILFERKQATLTTAGPEIESLSVQKGFLIGLAQCFALWPGVSRSMATIMGARFLGLTPQRAAEFSFYLAVPTLLGAAAHDAFKYRQIVFGSESSPALWIVGLVSSFITAFIVIRIFLSFLQSHSLQAFGWYRVALGVFCLFLLN